MDDYGPATYGESFADVYDEWYGDVSDTEGTVAALAGLAGDGPVLELGIGTGRIALPLADAGVDVVGVDASPSMLSVLRAKPGAERLTVHEADMADPPLEDGSVALVFAAFNTLFNLTDPDAQQRCLVAAHRVLRPAGRLVIEGFVPPADGLTDGGVSVREITTGRVVLTASRHDAADQVIRGQHIDISATGIRMRPWALRYRTPDQLDALARAAGFELESRAGGWRDERFDDDAEVHVSVYRRVDP